MVIEDNHELVTVKEAAKSIGIEKRIIEYHITTGMIKTYNGNIDRKDVDEIIKQKESLISIRSIMKKHHSGRFNAGSYRDRNKYVDFLEDNDYFGIKLTYPGSILFEIPKRDEYYIEKSNVQLLEYKSRIFFDDFGFSLGEKVQKAYENKNTNSNTKRCFNKFIVENDITEKDYTPSFLEFARLLFENGNVVKLSNDDIADIIESTKLSATKKWMCMFLNDVRACETVRYDKVRLKEKEPREIPAYSSDQMKQLGLVLFDKEYAKENNMLERALQNSFYAEQWFFLSLFFVCGWRSSDICEAWIYPYLTEDDSDLFQINLHTLKEDILEERIPREVFIRVTNYVLDKIEIAEQKPSKTEDNAEGTLQAVILPELRAFFGMLMLIAEYHMHINGEGYMKAHRRARYCNWVNCQDFFGEEMFSFTGRRNIQTKRITKAAMQGIELSGLTEGMGPIKTQMMAAMYRNHSSLLTTSIYVQDGRFTGETAETVLYMMLEVGVMPMYLYKLIITAYPNLLEEIPKKELLKLMEKIDVSPFTMETIAHEELAIAELERFGGDVSNVYLSNILIALYEICNGRGKSKIEGVGCINTALGKCCDKPKNDCLAICCEHNVLTRRGIPALLNTITDYMTKYKETGNQKYIAVLEQRIIPNFWEIITPLLKRMNEDEKLVIEKMIGEHMNG